MTNSDLIACCGSTEWASRMAARQSFPDSTAMHQAADDIWWSLTTGDWLEAFSKHPRIGQQSAAKWSSEEQTGMSRAGRQTAEEMAQLNDDYFNRFGFIFIVCATGKTADEMLHLLKARIHNSLEEEIKIAAAEQAQITHRRLDKL